MVHCEVGDILVTQGPVREPPDLQISIAVAVHISTP